MPGLCTDIEPDSTTSSLGQLPVTPEKNNPKFKLQEDVLVEHKDGRFYLGTVIAIGNCQCLVRFNDNTECWSDFRELTKLSGGTDADDAPACVVCKRQQAGDSDKWKSARTAAAAITSSVWMGTSSAMDTGSVGCEFLKGNWVFICFQK